MSPKSSRGPSWTLIAVIAFALAVDYLVYGIVLPLTPFSPANITKDEELALLSAAYAAGTLFATPIFGYLGDRFGCRRLMLAGAVLLAVATALLAFAPNFGVMTVGRLLQGVAAAATWTGGLAIVAENYSGERVRMMGYALMGSTGGSVIGPILAGGLHTIGGYRLPFLVVFGVVIIEALAIRFVLPRDDRSAPPSATVFSLLGDRGVFVPAIAVIVAASAWVIVEALVPNHLAHHGGGPTQIGSLFTITTLVYGLSAPFVTWLEARVGMRKTAVVGTIGMAILLPFIGIVTNVILIGCVMALVNVAYAVLLNPQSAALGDAVENRGLQCYCAVYSVYNVAYSIGTIGTSTLASVLLPHLSMLVVFLCVSGVLVLSVPLLLLPRSAPKILPLLET